MDINKMTLGEVLNLGHIQNLLHNLDRKQTRFLLEKLANETEQEDVSKFIKQRLKDYYKSYLDDFAQRFEVLKGFFDKMFD